MGITIGDAGGGSVAVNEATLPDVPAALPDELWVIKDSNGAVVSAGFQGITQKHPLPLTGGQRISLATGGIPDSPVNGYNVLTGTGVVQTANGLEVTLNAGNPEVIIDLPILGSKWWVDLMTEVSAVCAAPGAGAYFGLSMDSNAFSRSWGPASHSNGTNWGAASVIDGNVTRKGTSIVALGSLSSIGWVSNRMSRSFDNINQRDQNFNIGVLGLQAPLSTGQQALTGFELVSGTPSTADLHLIAKWASGDDLVVTWKSVISISGSLAQTSVN